MLSQGEGHTRSRRAGHSKSRTGCLTCKIRRVKCDETRPFCRRCTQSGRKCEEPAVPQIQFIQDQPTSRSTTPAPQLEVSLLVPQHSDDERRALHYFRQVSAPLFAGAVDAGFWEDLVPQLAQTQDFVWDVAVCLGSLMEHVPYMPQPVSFDSNTLPVVTNRGHRLALKCYNRAIMRVRQLAEQKQLDDTMLALSCILFASAEFQQKNVKSGADLIKRCCQILTGRLTLSQTRQNLNTGTSHLDVHQVVAPFVLRKAVLMATLGNTMPPPQRGNDDDEADNMAKKAVISDSATLDDIRAQFHILMYDSYELIRIGDFIPRMKPDDRDRVLFMSRRQLLLETLIQWKTSIAAAIDRRPDAELEAGWVHSYLSMYWAVCYISLSACVSVHQTAFDAYMEQFEELVKHAAIYLRHRAKSTNIQLRDSFDPGVMAPLFFCATKCRDPILRREALRLMRLAPREEIFWPFEAPASVAARVVSVEDGEYGASPSPPSSSDSRETQHPTLPPEGRRSVYNCVVSRQAPGGKQRQALQMSRFQYSPDGSRRLINEYIWLDDGEDG